MFLIADSQYFKRGEVEGVGRAKKKDTVYTVNKSTA